MDNIAIDELPRRAALLLRFEPHLSNYLPVPDFDPDAILVYREDTHTRRELTPERETPEPERPAVYLAYAACSSITFGRSDEVDVRLPGGHGISRRHFSLCWDPNSNVCFAQCHSTQGIIVNGARLNAGRETSTWALCPFTPNIIALPYALIRVAVLRQPWHLADDHIVTRAIRNEWLPRLSVGASSDTNDTDSNSSLTEPQMDWMGDCNIEVTPSRYIVLRDARWRLPWCANAWITIDARTRGCFLVTQFEPMHRDVLARFYIQHSIRVLNHARLLPTLAIHRCTTLPQQPTLLVQQGDPHVTSIDEDLEPADVAIVLRQMIDVLHYLHGRDIWHGHIRPEVIVRLGHSHHIAYYLTGLWERWIDQPSLSESAKSAEALCRQDTKRLGTLLLSLLETRPVNDAASVLGVQPMDPVLVQLLRSMADSSDETTQDFHEHISELTGGSDSSPFVSTGFSRRIYIATTTSSRGQLLLSAADTATLWESWMRNKLARWTLRQSLQELIKSLRETPHAFLPLSLFEQLVKRHGLDLPVLHQPTKGSGCHFVWVTEPISWLRGGTLVNLTQILPKANTNSQITIPPEISLEIQGLSTHRGLYVPYEWLEGNVDFRGLRKRLVRPPSGLADGWPTKHLQTFPLRDFILFATDLPWTSLIVMARSTSAIQWQPTVVNQVIPWLSREESLELCDEHNLKQLKTQIKTFESNRSPVVTLCSERVPRPSLPDAADIVVLEDLMADEEDTRQFKRTRK